MAYDIFLSYRRSGGKELARSLKADLERRGYRVFLDFDELKDGVFDRRIMEAIDSSPIFMILLSDHALDRCVNEDDWVRCEIEYALKRDRHVIPVNPDLSFKGFPVGLPESLKTGLGQHQFSEIMFGQLFMASVEKMVRERIEPLLQELGRAEASAKKQTGALFHVETDTECRIFKFGEEIAVARPGEDNKLRLGKGRYKLTIVSTECPEDRLQLVHAVEDNDIEDFLSIELIPVREKRLKAIREKEEAARKSELESIRKDGFEMVYVEGGTFTMGASESEPEANDWERPVHRVTLSGYYIGKYPITQKQWTEVMGSNPSYFKGDNLPVECVSWRDVQEFVCKLNERTGRNYRLPTEAEWEFAARGDNNSRGYKYSGSNNIDDVAWYFENSGNRTHPVGSKSPNELGIYDMSGNVWEWCQDWFGSYSSSAQTNPKGPSTGSYRVLRGGSCYFNASYCRVSDRNSGSPGSRSSYSGFRVVLIP